MALSRSSSEPLMRRSHSCDARLAVDVREAKVPSARRRMMSVRSGGQGAVRATQDDVGVEIADEVNSDWPCDPKKL